MSKVAWITGAGKGIGRHLALQLAAQGWQVAATARTVSDLASLQDQAEDLNGSIFTYGADITNEMKIEEIVETIEKKIGSIDLAILNAGTYIRFGIEDFSASAFAKQINVNVNGTVNCLAPVMKSMKARGQGQIAIVSSLSGYRGLPLASAYGASKAALTNMCEALKVELEPFGVTLSVVQPGFIKTPLTEKNNFPMPFLMEAELAAKRILIGIEKKKFEIVLPTRFAYILKFARLLPYFLYFKITRRILNK
jgi:NAD(P)-dependent dehydrogenase (short-subunit alcohol dehydrogenase family)